MKCSAVKRTTGVEVRPGPFGQDVGSAGQLGQLAPRRGGRDVVELGGGLVAEPAGVLLPDRPHDPRDLAVTLGDVELGRAG